MISISIFWSILKPFSSFPPRAAEKAEANADAEDGKKKKSGVQVPEEWPWEEAKKVFEHPDVTPAPELEVSLWQLSYDMYRALRSLFVFAMSLAMSNLTILHLSSSSGKTQT